MTASEAWEEYMRLNEEFVTTSSWRWLKIRKLKLELDIAHQRAMELLMEDSLAAASV